MKHLPQTKNSGCSCIIHLLFWTACCNSSCAALQLQTTTTISQSTTTINGSRSSISPSQQHAVQDYLARPIHWPDIVLSSNRVRVTKRAKRKRTKQSSAAAAAAFFNFNNLPTSIVSLFGASPSASTTNTDSNDNIIETNDSALPLQPGDVVQEYFGPMDVMSVEWTCIENSPRQGKLRLESSQGVPGMARDCVMDFDISTCNDNEEERKEAVVVVKVQLTMEYTPTNPLAVLATPILMVDNWIALNVLLKAALDPTPLDSFRKLMGNLYGVAGVAHFLDITVGESLLFQQSNIPPFANLSLEGQAYALVWCAVGPLAYTLSRQRGQIIENDDEDNDDTTTALVGIPVTAAADWGLLLYGLVEVLGASFSGDSMIVAKAAAVQGIVAAAWFYSRQKQEDQTMLLLTLSDKATATTPVL